MALQPFVGAGRFFSFVIFYTYDRTPSTGDQYVWRPLPAHRTAQRINAHRHPCLKWVSNPRSQCLNGRRQFMPYTARTLLSQIIIIFFFNWLHIPALTASKPNKIGSCLTYKCDLQVHHLPVGSVGCPRRCCRFLNWYVLHDEVVSLMRNPQSEGNCYNTGLKLQTSVFSEVKM
jgi:hypothetical protein